VTKQTLDALGAMGYATQALSRGEIGIGASILRRAHDVQGTLDPRVEGAAEGF
jgi:gamma-glutamyltranspeptidase